MADKVFSDRQNELAFSPFVVRILVGSGGAVWYQAVGTEVLFKVVIFEWKA